MPKPVGIRRPNNSGSTMQKQIKKTVDGSIASAGYGNKSRIPSRIKPT